MYINALYMSLTILVAFQLLGHFIDIFSKCTICSVMLAILVLC